MSEETAKNSIYENMCIFNRLCPISTDWKRAKGGNAFVGFPSEIPTSLGASYRTWPVVHNTNGQDHDYRSIAVSDGRCFFYGDDHVLSSPSAT